tara:strand:+ start:4215 stop:4655 length:441 start_codon:yes stop_codon:yes gene_type:complete
MATGLLNGSELVLRINKPFLGWRDVAYATNFELEINSEIIDQTNKDSEGWKKIILGCRNWSIKCDALYQNEQNPLFGSYIDFFTELENNNLYSVKFEIKNANAAHNNVYYLGQVRVISLNLKGQTEVGAEYQIFLAGARSLTQIDV